MSCCRDVLTNTPYSTQLRKHLCLDRSLQKSHHNHFNTLFNENDNNVKMISYLPLSACPITWSFELILRYLGTDFTRAAMIN